MLAVTVKPPTSHASGAAPSKRFSIATLGCKVNGFESELIAHGLLGKPSPGSPGQHYQRVDAAQQADVCVINTCTVTAEADRQSRQRVRRAVRDNPEAVVVVTGCYAQIDPAACAAIPGVDWVVGNGRKLDIPALLESAPRWSTSAKQEPVNAMPPAGVGDVVAEMRLPEHAPQHLISGFDGRARAFVQIQQGCDQGCTFCIIHQARGPNRSFSAGMIARQAERLVAGGHRELVICGVDIGSYGADFAADSAADSCKDLAALLKRLTAIPGDFRIRLSSIDPAHLTDELIELIAAEPIICPQLHLSLQSGNTLILKRMKRRATREVMDERVQRLRRAAPHMVLSADILVGFPTETEAHFADTLSMVDALEIAYPHVFAYSKRAGTPAANIPSQVPVDERKQRAARVRALGKQVWRRVAERHIGARFKVLIEKRDNLPPGMAMGRAADYFPVIFPSENGQPGEWAEVEVSAVEGAMLIAAG